MTTQTKREAARAAIRNNASEIASKSLEWRFRWELYVLSNGALVWRERQKDQSTLDTTHNPHMAYVGHLHQHQTRCGQPHEYLQHGLNATRVAIPFGFFDDEKR